MRIKLDENVAHSAAIRLAALGHDVHTVLDEKLSGRPDETVWKAAQTEERFLVTQDLDFSDTRRFAAGLHAGVLLIRLPDVEQWRVADYLAAWFSAPDSDTWRGASSSPLRTRCAYVALQGSRHASPACGWRNASADSQPPAAPRPRFSAAASRDRRPCPESGARGHGR